MYDVRIYIVLPTIEDYIAIPSTEDCMMSLSTQDCFMSPSTKDCFTIPLFASFNLLNVLAYNFYLRSCLICYLRICLINLTQRFAL